MRSESQVGEKCTEVKELGLFEAAFAQGRRIVVAQSQQSDCIWLREAGKGFKFYSNQMRRLQRVLNRQLMRSNYFSKLIESRGS